MNISRVGEKNVSTKGDLMTIIEYRGNKDISIKFDNYEHIAKARYDHFLSGKVKNVMHKNLYKRGYIGIGQYSSSFKNKEVKAYSVWKEMFRRCYSDEYLERQPTYENCSVCEEWYNYQNFANWFENNYYEISGKTSALDKDIFTKGNKIYNPKNCVFVPQCINNLIVNNKSIRGDSPVGVCYDKSAGNF